MTISLSEVSKRFNRDWIFRNFSYNFTNDHSYAITGPNGSGKSTLLQVICGAIVMSEGEIFYTENSEYRTQNTEYGSQESEVRSQKSEEVENQKKSEPVRSISSENIYKYISIAAPYLEVIEEMTATEFLQFHHKFKPFLPHCNIPQMLSIIGLEKAANKQIRYYSSGMKQRIKLAQAIFSDTPVILLDEPCTNLDEQGIQLYHQLISEYCNRRLVIVSSNDIQEYEFCSERISIMNYKR